MIDTATRTAFNEDHAMFRDSVRKFFDRALYPNLDRWEEEGIVDRGFWKACGEAGVLCPQVPEEYGDRFDVMGLRKHVKGLNGTEFITSGNQLLQVPRQSSRIARDITQTSRAQI